MLREGLSKLLRDEIETLLAPIAGTPGIYDLVKESLSEGKQGIVANIRDGHVWSLFPLIVSEAICGRWEHALTAGAGLELLKTSAEVFDDIEDADSTESLSAKHGNQLATNAACVLLILAERAFTRLKSMGVDSDRVVSLIDTVNSYYITACIGQHLDLSLTLEGAITEDAYLRVIAMKSASALECACYTGAMLAGANQKLIKSFTLFGRNLGMSSQIANDIKGILRLNDIKKRKITLPIIYALAQTDGETHKLMERLFCKPIIEFAYIPEQIRDLLFSVGAIQYATIKMELYKQRSMKILIGLARAGIKVEQLEQFLK